MPFDTNLDFDRNGGQATAVSFAELDELDLSVIHLSRKERLQTVLPATTFGRWLGILFGIASSRPLADQRLEALRRYCVLARNRHPRVEEAWLLLIQSGFAGSQRRRIDALIG
jgi:hypothetical protein